jgi:hypothetical protein
MTNPTKPLYREPVQLNVQLHRHKKLKPTNDHSVLSGTHAVFLNAVEFPQAALHFPIVFVPGTVANPEIAPMAMMGLVPNDNLFVVDDRWDSAYLPAFFRRLPYLTAPLPGTDQIGVYIDAQWPALSDTEGEPLFTAEGEQAPILTQAIDFLKAFDQESQRTAQLCARMKALGLFTEMKADVDLPGGNKLSVDGFMVIDENKLATLPESVVIELHRNGTLGVLQAHLMSLNNLRGLTERHIRRTTQAA